MKITSSILATLLLPSYCLIFAFHPHLDIKRIVIFRSFQQTLKELNDVNCLNRDRLKEVNSVTANQLQDFTIQVFEKKEKFAISEMFSCELKFTSYCLKKWFASKYKRRFLELDTFAKMHYEKENLIDWSKTKCNICDFKLLLRSAHGPDSEEMTYFDFIVCKEHMFTKNIFE